MRYVFCIIPSTSELALYSTVYYHIVYYGGRVYGYDRGYEGGNLASMILDDWKIDQDLLKINCDIMSAIYLAKNHVYHERTKHIDIKFHFIWEIFDEGDIKLQKIHTKENPTDMLTKVALRVKFAHCKELFYILQVSWDRWSSFGRTTNGLLPWARGTLATIFGAAQ